jgi:hypothetical protein
MSGMDRHAKKRRLDALDLEADLVTDALDDVEDLGIKRKGRIKSKRKLLDYIREI